MEKRQLMRGISGKKENLWTKVTKGKRRKPKVSEMERRRSQTEHRRAKGGQKGARREQKDPKWEPNGYQKAIKMEPKGGKGAQSAPFAEQDEKTRKRVRGSMQIGLNWDWTLPVRPWRLAHTEI
jgi:hypothetical protein